MGEDEDCVADAVLVVPPPSPSDTNPPLGPAIVARVAHRAGFKVRVVDLNALHINRFRGMTLRRETSAVGDHGKNRPLVASAAQWLYGLTGLHEFAPEFLPEGADPVALTMHLDLAAPQALAVSDPAAVGEPATLF